MPQTLLMVPGYNEPPIHFDVLANGRGGIPGLRARGYTCSMFPQEDDDLRDRIDRFAEHLAQMRRTGTTFPIVAIGYSLGGLVVRGFLRAFPERAHEISHTILIATPNWGVTVLAMPPITRMLRIPDQAMGDMDLDSDFMRWMNGTGGHWTRDDKGARVWQLNGEPIVGPADAKILVIQGLIPARGDDNDGLVWADSATLGNRINAHYIVGPHCNHMNIIGHFDFFIMVGKGFLSNDKVWPLTLAAIVKFVESA